MSLSPSKMFFRLLLRAATVRCGRTLTALFAMAVAATLATALLNLYSDIGAKLSGDFRKFGANVIITASNGMSDAQSAEVAKALPPGTLVLPSALAIAKTASGKPVVVVGTDFDVARKMNSFWSVSQWPIAPGQALLGTRAAKLIASETRPSLEFKGKMLDLAQTSMLQTGGQEDDRIYISLREFEQWTGVRPSVLELSVPGTEQDVTNLMATMRGSLPETVAVQPVRQIVEAETRVLYKTRFILLLSTIAITLTVALCVLATLTASVLERRKDYAVMKALGSSRQAVYAIFLGETFSLAVIGAIIGFAAGCGLAIWIGHANFHAALEPRISVFPPVLAGCLAIALLSALVPLSILQKTEPAAMLKGD